MPWADNEYGKSRRRDYQKTEEGKRRHFEANKRWRHRNAKRLAAHNAVAKAIMSGNLVPWPGCAVCDCTKVNAHHADYDNKLGVTWLCDKHHKEAHSIVGFRSKN